VFLLSPKSCANPWSETGDRELDLEELTRVMLFIPCCPDVTSLTGALDRSDRCKPFVRFASSERLVLLLVSSWQVSRSSARLCVGFFPLQVLYSEVVFLQGLEESLRLPGMFSVQSL
jgi:hypothetical protein